MTEISVSRPPSLSPLHPPPPERLRNNIVIKRNCWRGTGNGGRGQGGWEGEKIADADGAINVCLRGPRKNLIIPGVFSCRSCEDRARGRGTGDRGTGRGVAEAWRKGRPFGRARGEFHFRVPSTRMTVLPPLSTAAGRKKGPPVSPATPVTILRGVTGSIYPAGGSVGMQRG